MADNNKTAIGCRADLNVDVSRCLKMRFSESSCRRCVEICPHGAVILEGGLTINPDLCRGCMLCTSICPAGALEQKDDFNACLAKLSKAPEPILGCCRTRECSHGTVACLGALSEEHLVALCHTLSGRLTINLSSCSNCPNNPVIPYLRQRLKIIFEAGLLEGGSCILTAESAQEMNYRDESVDRRGFFKSFSSSLFQSAAVILSSHNEQTEYQTNYAGKRVPTRRELLNGTRITLSEKLSIQIRKHFDSCVSFDETCTKCQGCVAICPTGALKTEVYEEAPIFRQLLCTGCGLCREFCLDGSLSYIQPKIGSLITESV